MALIDTPSSCTTMNISSRACPSRLLILPSSPLLMPNPHLVSVIESMNAIPPPSPLPSRAKHEVEH